MWMSATSQKVVGQEGPPLLGENYRELNFVYVITRYLGAVFCGTKKEACEIDKLDFIGTL